MRNNQALLQVEWAVFIIMHEKSGLPTPAQPMKKIRDMLSNRSAQAWQVAENWGGKAMNRRIPKCAVAALFAWLALYGLEKLAQAQSASTGGSTGGSSGGSLLSGGGGMSGGSTISGGSGGAGGSTTGQSFSGGQGASYSGGTTSGGGTTRGSSSASTTTIPAASNVLGPNYVNPMSRGIKLSSGAMATPSFNKPIYAPTTTTTTSRSTANTRTNTSANANGNFSTQGLDRGATPYTTGLSEDVPVFRPVASALEAELKDIIQRSSALQSKDKITVAVDGGAVVLRGEVASAKERGLAERLLRLEPGVHVVSNELTVKVNP